jgi:predicted HTH domain antitoxin
MTTPTSTPNRLAVLREDPKTSRVGTNWTPEEDTTLLDQVNVQQMDYDKIAVEHQRTSNSVKTRVIEIYLKKIVNKEVTLEEASETVRLPVAMFTAAQRRRELRQERRKTSKTQTVPKAEKSINEPKQVTSDVISLLKEINGKLDRIINASTKET